VDYEEVDVDVDRDGDDGDYLCLFTATAPRTRFESAQLRAAYSA
jgi:hypothetical protein